MFHDLDLRRAFQIAWHQRWLMVVTLAAAFLAAIIYLHVARPVYTVSIQIMPSPASNQPSQISGAASALAGLGLGSGNSSTSFKVYTATLQSRPAAETLAADQPLMHAMFADQWSDEDHAWHEPGGIVHSLTAFARSVLLGPRPWQAPSADNVQEFLSNSVLISDSRDTPIVTVSINSTDPGLAATVLSKLTSNVDRIVRDHALDRANQYIIFINQELAHVTVAEYRTALVEHLYEQEKSRIMASAVNVSYAADVLGHPASSPRPTSPAPLAAFIVALIAGTLIGFLLALYYEYNNWTFALRWPPRVRQGISIHSVGSPAK